MKRTGEEGLLIELLSHSLIDTSVSVGMDESLSFEELLKLASHHAVLPLLSPMRNRFPVGFRDNFMSACNTQVLQWYHLFFETKYIVELLGAHGIETVILKGVAASYYYPYMQLRKSGDIDLFLLDTSRADDAVSVLISEGFVYNNSDQTENHQIVLWGHNRIEIELHTMLVEPFDKEEINAELRRIESELSSHVRTVEIFGTALPFLEDGYLAFTLLLHALQHFLRRGFGLKLLCDLLVIFDHGMRKEDIRVYQSLVERVKISGFSALLLSTLYYEMGLSEKSLPCELMDENYCTDFMDDVLSDGEFGDGDSNKMVLVRGRNLIGLFREFNHQTELRFLGLRGKYVLYPFLWCYMLVRFLYNNKRIRKTTTASVIKKTMERSRLIDHLKLFER